MFNPLVKINNRVCIPKIVPLVYDDVLSYYEMLNKFIVKINEAITALNALGVKVDVLEAAVQELQTAMQQFDTRITTNETNITALQGAVTTINNAIDVINGSLTTLGGKVANNEASITDINNTIASIQSSISDILDELTGLPATVEDMEQDISGLDTRVTTLESAAFGDLSLSPVPKNFCCNMTIFDKLQYEIVKPSDYDTTLDDTVKIEYDQFRFRGASNYNQTYLRLKNFCPKLATTEALTLAFIFADTYSEYGQCIDTTFGDLLSGISCITGVTNEICVGGATLTLNEDDGDHEMYDLNLFVNAQNGSGTYIANSRFYLEWAAILGGVGYLTQGRGSADAVRAYMNAYNGGIPDNSADISSLETRMTAAEGDIDTLQSTVSSQGTSITSINSSITTINNKNTQQDSSISSLGTRVTALEGGGTVEEWDSWEDVFEEAEITPYSRIIGFHMQKVGKVVTFEIAGCHFRNDSNHNSTSFLLGTLRSGLRSKLTPRGNVPCTFTGLVAYTDGNLTGIEMNGDSNSNYCPLVPNARGVAVATLFGNTTAVPYTWDERTNKAYSLNVNICGMPYQTQSQAVTNNAFIIRGCYVTI